MKLTHEGLSLWYGTPDAPAPLDEIISPTNASLMVGAHPANPTNTVELRYRVDGGTIETLPGRELHTDHPRQNQYFVVAFPSLSGGKVVEYCPVLKCAGRQVPSPSAGERFPSKFFPTAPAVVAEASVPPAVQRHRCPDLAFVASVCVRLDRAQFIGESPQGVRINFYGLGGTVAGPVLNGELLPGSSDHLFVRPDGVGIVRVRAVIATHDGAMLEVEYGGTLELGEDGYQRALANDPPSYPTLVIALRVLTGHPKYRWLNRLQLFGFGKVFRPESRLEFDMFAPAQQHANTPA